MPVVVCHENLPAVTQTQIFGFSCTGDYCQLALALCLINVTQLFFFLLWFWEEKPVLIKVILT